MEVAVGGWRGRWSPWAVLGSLIWVCLLCSPHCRGTWDSRGWPPALGTSLPAAPAQQSACHCTAASTPRGTLDLHWVRPQGDLDLRPLSWETSPSLSLISVKWVQSIQLSRRPATCHTHGFACLSPSHYRASLGGQPYIGHHAPAISSN